MGQPFQAICAIQAANKLDKMLFFHITTNSPTDKNAIIENLKEIFKSTQHELVIHPWMSTEKFHKLINNCTFSPSNPLKSLSDFIKACIFHFENITNPADFIKVMSVGITYEGIM